MALSSRRLPKSVVAASWIARGSSAVVVRRNSGGGIDFCRSITTKFSGATTAISIVPTRRPQQQPPITTTTTTSTRWSSSSLAAAAATSATNNNSQQQQQQQEREPLPQIIATKGVPIHLYAYEIEPAALQQLILLAESPLPVDYISSMPDAHLGQGVTIGTVFASERYVAPLAVGVDIGCGMAAIPIEGLYKAHVTDRQRSEIQQAIKERVPTGFNQHKNTLKGTKAVLDQISQETPPSDYLAKQLLLPRVTDQLGTLGGGNHFIEIVTEEQSGQVWVMLHSGSRNIGNRTATHYDDLAKTMLQQKHGDAHVRKLQGLHYLEIESDVGQQYLQDMTWCQQYAFHNRRVMKEIVLDIVHKVTGKEADMNNAVNIHHNYCACEDCGNGRKLWVTRKGATSAKKGEMGIIPGSMGTGSYITRGRGNPMGWSSSSHGAGRRMSRTAAHSKIAQGDFERSMNGITCDTHPSVKDEAPMAYKDLAEVMKHQESLTDIVYRLLPMINVKGYETKLPKKYQPNYNKQRNAKGAKT
jgi:tRNA-splicing ligase RtcB (3'-phosphate/5'-hydroxy nucleic acid ligase)